MGAAVISLVEVREQKQRAQFRQQLHEQFDQWLDTLEAQVKEAKPTHAPCPQCGRRVAARGVVTRKVETLVGEVELARPVFLLGALWAGLCAAGYDLGGGARPQ